jgi:hypothetical protein
VIPLPAFSWGLAAKLAAIVGVVAALWWAQGRIRVSYEAEQKLGAAIEQHASYKELVEANAIRAVARMQADAVDDAALATKIDALEAEREDLKRAGQRVPATVEKPDANGVPRLAINDAWWLCRSALLTRDSADVAACKARAGDAVVPDALSR